MTFQVRKGRRWTSIGTDDTAPYRVFHDVSGLRAGTRLQYRAIVLDNRGHTRKSRARSARVPAPALTWDAPRGAEGSKQRDEVLLRLFADPERATHVVSFERSVAGGPWTAIGSDSSSPAYVHRDDFAGLARHGDEDRLPGHARRAGRDAGDERGADDRGGGAAARRRPTCATGARTATTTSWGLHVWGDASTRGGRRDRVGGAVAGDARRGRLGGVSRSRSRTTRKAVNFIMHKPAGDTVPTRASPAATARSCRSRTRTIWLKAGDPTIYTSQPATP